VDVSGVDEELPPALERSFADAKQVTGRCAVHVQRPVLCTACTQPIAVGLFSSSYNH
jgi:hypothetical protein